MKNCENGTSVLFIYVSVLVEYLVQRIIFVTVKYRLDGALSQGETVSQFIDPAGLFCLMIAFLLRKSPIKKSDRFVIELGLEAVLTSFRPPDEAFSQVGAFFAAKFVVEALLYLGARWRCRGK